MIEEPFDEILVERGPVVVSLPRRSGDRPTKAMADR